jgi:hypothetical protein
MSSKMQSKKTQRAAARARAANGTSFPGVKVSALPRSNGRASVVSLMSHPIFGGRLTSNTETIPAAFVNIIGNQTFYNENSKVLRPELGMDPVNIVGCQPLTDILGAVATPDVFATGTLATAVDVNHIYINPDTLNGPIAAKANLYDKYVFRDILIEYITVSASTQTSALALGLTEDATVFPTTFSTVRQVVPSVTFPFRAERAFLHYHYAGPQLWYNLVDSTSTASLRSTTQCTLSGYTSANLTVIVPGYLNIYYSVDLYDPVPSQGFTLSVAKLERDFLRKFLVELRKENETKKVEILDKCMDLVSDDTVVVSPARAVAPPTYGRK